jgi:putative oxidoreductase
MASVIDLIARILLAHIFLISGFNKVFGYAGTQTHMDAAGVPGILLPLVILVEVGGGLALLLGWRTRWAAWALASFCILAALLFHADFADRMQTIQFMKNLAIAGGLLLLGAHGAGELSMDQRLAKNTAQIRADQTGARDDA